uniref:Fibrinogen C-terminal domain-containing protein n=1 Tax=Magallana gigas TaxID=29159 RepID=A0A8W8I456_MAGGI
KKNQILRIDLVKFSGERAHAVYSSFFVNDEANKYKLTLGSFNGTKGLGDSLTARSNNMYFSTKDKDNSAGCAVLYKTAGWFNACFYTNLNGPYQKNSRKNGKELTWYHWGSTWRSLKSAKMMIRPM